MLRNFNIFKRSFLGDEYILVYFPENSKKKRTIALVGGCPDPPTKLSYGPYDSFPREILS